MIIPPLVSILDKSLLLAHTVAAGVLVGSSTHLALQSIALLRGRARARLLRIYPPVVFTAWLVVIALGAAMYPTYRVAVRHEYLDIYAVWASILFDIKENLALFVGPLLAGAWLMSGAISEELEITMRRWFAAACICAALIAWWNTLSGILIVSVRSV